MKVLVTGAAGRIGQEIVRDLLSSSHEVRGIDVRMDVPFVNERIAPLVTESDIRDLSQMESVCEGMEAVIHLAAIPGPGPRDNRDHWVDIVHRNILGTYNVLEASVRQKVRRVIFASSLCAEGWLPGEHCHQPLYFPLDEDHPLGTEEPYGMSKQIGEIYGWGFHQRAGLEFMSLRPMNVQDARATGPGVLHSSQPTWQRVDRGDVSNAFRLALESDRKWGIYQICSRYRYRQDGTRQSLDELMENIHTSFPTGPAIKDLDWFMSGGGTFSCRKAMQELGYDPKF